MMHTPLPKELTKEELRFKGIYDQLQQLRRQFADLQRTGGKSEASTGADKRQGSNSTPQEAGQKSKKSKGSKSDKKGKSAGGSKSSSSNETASNDKLSATEKAKLLVKSGTLQIGGDTSRQKFKRRGDSVSAQSESTEQIAKSLLEEDEADEDIPMFQPGAAIVEPRDERTLVLKALAPMGLQSVNDACAKFGELECPPEMKNNNKEALVVYKRHVSARIAQKQLQTTPICGNITCKVYWLSKHQFMQQQHALQQSSAQVGFQRMKQQPPTTTVEKRQRVDEAGGEEETKGKGAETKTPRAAAPEENRGLRRYDDDLFS